MIAVPVCFDVANPLVAYALLTRATLFAEDSHSTCLVRSCVVPSEKLPVAVYCTDHPTAVVVLAGVTVMEDSVALVTVSVAVAVRLPSVAVMVELPAPIAVALPQSGEPLLMVAIPVEDELQATA